MTPHHLYRLLGLPSTATIDEVEAQTRRLGRVFEAATALQIALEGVDGELLEGFCPLQVRNANRRTVFGVLSDAFQASDLLKSLDAEGITIVPDDSVVAIREDGSAVTLSN